MFRCQMCDVVVPAGTRTTKVVMATRQRIYEPRGQDPRERRGGRSFRGRRGPRKKKPYDKGGEGTEIVRELSVCPTCAAEQAQLEPEHVHVPATMNLTAAAAAMEAAGESDSGAEENGSSDSES